MTPYRTHLFRALIAMAVTLALVEAVLRAFVVPSERSYGKLRGIELAPLRIVHRGAPEADIGAKPVEAADGETIASSDVHGVLVEDAELGYVLAPSARSANGWFVTNNLGARSSHDATPDVSPGRRRILFFGESYAAGEELKQAESWPEVLSEMAPQLDVMNFGVGGYSMAQTYLRFLRTAAYVDYDTAVFVWVPSADAFREVNVVRRLASPTWSSETVMPRFTLSDGHLQRIAPIYERGTETYARDFPVASPELRAHLLRYDRFYFPFLYEDVDDPLGNTVLGRLVRSVYGEVLRTRLVESASDADSEAVAVSLAMFREAQDRVRAAGKRFVLVVLPSMREVLQRRFRASAVVERAKGCGLDVEDLSRDLIGAPEAEIDTGRIAGRHYGPRLSRRLAAVLNEKLSLN